MYLMLVPEVVGLLLSYMELISQAADLAGQPASLTLMAAGMTLHCTISFYTLLRSCDTKCYCNISVYTEDILNST